MEDNKIMTVEQLIIEVKKVVNKMDKKTYPWLTSVIEDMEKNPKVYEKYLKMKYPVEEVLYDNA